MIAVIIEVEPAEGRTGEYLDRAAELRPELDRIDGFISVERFRSLANPKKLLSLSFFRDEEAVRAWRERPNHRQAQADGKRDVFDAYRMRVAEVVRDYGKQGSPAAEG